MMQIRQVSGQSLCPCTQAQERKEVAYHVTPSGSRQRSKGYRLVAWASQGQCREADRPTKAALLGPFVMGCLIARQAHASSCSELTKNRERPWNGPAIVIDRGLLSEIFSTEGSFNCSHSHPINCFEGFLSSKPVGFMKLRISLVALCFTN